MAPFVKSVAKGICAFGCYRYFLLVEGGIKYISVCAERQRVARKQFVHPGSFNFLLEKVDIKYCESNLYIRAFREERHAYISWCRGYNGCPY